jgi:two-component system chemotaxis response regulator CheY
MTTPAPNVLARTLSVLIVDDSATTRAMIARIVRMVATSAVDVHHAGNGLAALEVLSANEVDLVMADLNMPGMDGEQLIGRMRADPALSGIPVVVISALPDPERIEALCRNGALGFLAKPFTPESVRDLIRPVLSARTGGSHDHA